MTPLLRCANLKSVPPGYRSCSNCGRTKPLNEFRSRPSTYRDNRGGVCKACVTLQQWKRNVRWSSRSVNRMCGRISRSNDLAIVANLIRMAVVECGGFDLLVADLVEALRRGRGGTRDQLTTFNALCRMMTLEGEARRSEEYTIPLHVLTDKELRAITERMESMAGRE